MPTQFISVVTSNGEPKTICLSSIAWIEATKTTNCALIFLNSQSSIETKENYSSFVGKLSTIG
jgi:hypothetical protein